MEWISVIDRPLFIIDDKWGWECTEDGDKPFMAAVPYQDANSDDPEKWRWWIHHCIIEDKIGLCIVGEMDNEPAGWDMQDVLYYSHITEPPKTI